MNAPVLRVNGIQKRHGGVHAPRGVDLDLAAGEAHGLLGGNGAGRSTLTGVLSGAVVPGEGTITLDGRAIRLASPREAHAAGIALIPQELAAPFPPAARQTASDIPELRQS